MPSIARLLTLLLFATLIPVAGLSASSEQILYNFNRSATTPGGLVFDKQGNLYGISLDGGQANLGAVFELSPSANGWTETVLYSFGEDTGHPVQTESLAFDKAGNLYGTTTFGGKNNRGTVFRLSPNAGGVGLQWTETIIHSFLASPGQSPMAGVVLDAAGNLYGTTYGLFGPTDGANGAIFEISPQSATAVRYRVLHAFQDAGAGDGSGPEAALTFDAAGNLYGTTWAGGIAGCGVAQNGCGTVFKLTPTKNGGWSYRQIYKFQGLSDGAAPDGSVVVAPNGDIYGTTVMGGIDQYEYCQSGYYGCGTVFQLSPNSDGTYTHAVLYMFNGPPTDGGSAQSGLILDAGGNLFGTTERGGLLNDGTVFELSPNAGGWQETILHSFGSGSDGYFLDTQPIMDNAGNIYGTTFGGGTNSYGTVFKITP